MTPLYQQLSDALGVVESVLQVDNSDTALPQAVWQALRKMEQIQEYLETMEDRRRVVVVRT